MAFFSTFWSQFWLWQLIFDNFSCDSFGSDNFGFDNIGSDSIGSDSFGSDNIGSDSFGPDNIGYDNKIFDKNIFDNFGSDNIGCDSFGCDSIGCDSFGSDNKIFDKKKFDKKVSYKIFMWFVIQPFSLLLSNDKKINDRQDILTHSNPNLNYGHATYLATLFPPTLEIFLVSTPHDSARNSFTSFFSHSISLYLIIWGPYCLNIFCCKALWWL